MAGRRKYDRWREGGKKMSFRVRQRKRGGERERKRGERYRVEV